MACGCKTSRCTTDIKRPRRHRCCHLPNQAENIDCSANIPYNFTTGCEMSFGKKYYPFPWLIKASLAQRSPFPSHFCGVHDCDKQTDRHTDTHTECEKRTTGPRNTVSSPSTSASSHNLVDFSTPYLQLCGSVAEWLACCTQAQMGLSQISVTDTTYFLLTSSVVTGVTSVRVDKQTTCYQKRIEF